MQVDNPMHRKDEIQAVHKFLLSQQNGKSKGCKCVKDVIMM